MSGVPHSYTAEQERLFAKVIGFLQESGYGPFADDVRDLYWQLKERLDGPKTPRILDESEIKAIARKSGLAKYMWDTEEGRMDLARFAHEVSLFATSHRQEEK